MRVKPWQESFCMALPESKILISDKFKLVKTKQNERISQSRPIRRVAYNLGLLNVF